MQDPSNLSERDLQILRSCRFDSVQKIVQSRDRQIWLRSHGEAFGAEKVDHAVVDVLALERNEFSLFISLKIAGFALERPNFKFVYSKA